MKVDMTIQLEDKPGSLIGALKPISSHGGNIISVTHVRGEKELVLVNITFNAPDKSSLELIRKALSENKVRISNIEVEGRQYYSRRCLSFIIVGHVIDKDVRNTIDRINKVGLVMDIDVVMPDPEEKSSVMMNVEIDNGKLDKLMKVMSRVCKEKDFLLIRSIG